jgi:hypothetical protein
MNGPTAIASSRQSRTQRVERGEDTAPQRVADVLVQQREAQHVDGAGPDADERDEKDRGRERRRRRAAMSALPASTRPPVNNHSFGTYDFTSDSDTTPTATPTPNANVTEP